MENKIILAYSGGLDTSVILKWLLEKHFEVVAYIADVGQEEDFEAAERKALNIGASKVIVKDLREEFVTDFIFEALKAGCVYERRYLLGTSLARPLIAKYHVKIAEQEGAAWISHGATGKGNDQVRFELGAYALNPEIKILAPWKDPGFLAAFQGRNDLLSYAESHGIPVEATRKAPYSMDANLMHISYEAGVLENAAAAPSEEMFRMTVSPEKAPDTPACLSIEFRHGLPVRVVNKNSGQSVEQPLSIFKYLNEIGGSNGVGRIDIVENRYVGMKSRGVYETPGGTILWAAHQDLELLCLDREVYRIKEQLSQKYAELTYNGYWYSPEAEYLRSCFDLTQSQVNGVVDLKLYKGNVIVEGRASDTSLYDPELASMDVAGGYDQLDARGFINVNAVRLKINKKAGRVQYKKV